MSELPDDVRELLAELAQGLYLVDGEWPSMRARELLDKYPSAPVAESPAS
jgi:hypothetical protein